MGKNHFKIKIMLPCSFFSKKSLSVTLSCPNITVKEMLKNENKNGVYPPSVFLFLWISLQVNTCFETLF